MDPQRAYDVFQAAAMTTSVLSQGRVCFFEMNDAHFSEVRSMKSRNEAAALAKKYVKACEAVAELEKAFGTHATPTCIDLAHRFTTTLPLLLVKKHA